MPTVTINAKEFVLDANEPLLAAVHRYAGKKDTTIVGAKIGELLYDLSYVPPRDVVIEPVHAASEEGLTILRHSAAHIMAEAVRALFNNAKVTIGPAIKDGFYYDFDVEKPFTDADLALIEKEMKTIVEANVPFTRSECSKRDALLRFEKEGEPYKVEILNEIEGDTVSLYTQGAFVDLCRGPHIPSTGYLKAFALLSVAGSYWRGDAKNKMLSRIYGTAFANRQDLEAYLKRMKEAKERDHRKIGKELDLFSFQDEGPGFPFWHPNGMAVYKALEAYIREENAARGYEEIKTPVILNEALWHISGHWDNFRENMYFTEVDETGYAIKPMNCPGGILVYKSQMRSYRDLPIRNAELGLVHRHELSGVLHGLFRVRAFTQDDAHIFCGEAQLEEEIGRAIAYTLDVYKTFGFEDVTIFVATRPEKSIGSEETWEFATNALTNALAQRSIAFKLKEGEGAFYGPKIEFNIKDTLERNWQCGTIQVDLSMPGRFGATYEGADGKRHTPIMIHRAIFGSLERFIGILIEHYNGKFPLWLAPVQAAVVPVAAVEGQITRAKEIASALKEHGFRVAVDERNENLGYKIRHWRLQRIPYTIIIGEEELASDTLSLRLRGGKELKARTLDNVIKNLKEENTLRMNSSLYEEGRDC